MRQNEIIDFLDNILPDIVRTNDPETIMLKAASSKGLSIAQLEKLAHVFNTQKTLVGLDKAPERGASWTLVNVPELLSKYATYDRNTYSENKLSEDIDYETYLLLGDIGGMNIKAASTKRSLPELTKNNYKVPDYNFADMPLCKKSRVNLMYESDRMKNVSEREFKEVCETVISETAYEIGDLINKVASYVKDNGEDVWHEIVSDTVLINNDLAESVIPYMENVLKSRNIKYASVDMAKCASTSYASLVRDRHNIVSVFEDIFDNYTVQKKATEMLKQSAEVTDDPRSISTVKVDDSVNLDDIIEAAINEPMRGRAEGGATRETAEDITEELSDNLSALLGGLKKPLYSKKDSILETPGKVLDISEKIIDKVKPKFDNHRKIIDEAEYNAKVNTTLQSLLTEDDIIREADPNEVYDIFTTIKDINPTIVTNPKLLADIIKEALQYGSVPTHQLKILSELRGSELKNKELESRLDSSEYRL